MMKEERKEGRKITVHHLLAHSYFTFFMGLMFGLLSHLAFPAKVLPTEYTVIGFPIIIMGTLLVLWAQSTSRSLREKSEPLTANDFRRGPYAFSRRPTNLGLAVLVIGVGILINSLTVIVVSLVAMLVTHYAFLSREERMLERSYGEEYCQYKKKTRAWI